MSLCIAPVLTEPPFTVNRRPPQLVYSLQPEFPVSSLILPQNHMPAALWCQPQIALAARWVANALVGQFR